MTTFLDFFKKQKLLGIMSILLIGGVSYFGYQKIFNARAAVRYVTAQVQRSSLVVSVSGNGQIAASNQIDLKPQASGEITRLHAAVGQQVTSGDVLLTINAKDALQSVRDAQLNLESAALALEKLKAPADDLSRIQAQNALTQAGDNFANLNATQRTDYENSLWALQKAKDDLQKAHDDGFTDISNAFLDLPTIMTGLQDVVIGQGLMAGLWNIDYYANEVKNYDDRVVAYRNQAYTDYLAARGAYDKNFGDYKISNRTSDDQTALSALLQETYQTTQLTTNAIKSMTNLIDFYKDRLAEHSRQAPSSAATQVASLTTYTGKANNHLSTLLDIQHTIKNTNDTLITSQRDLDTLKEKQPRDLAAAQQSIIEKQAALNKLVAGASTLDIQSQQLTVQQRRNAVVSAQENLTNYSLRAPFAGVVAKVDVKLGDTASPSSAALTLMTSQKIATVALNEVDVAKVKIGQKVTLTLDAIDGLTLTGKVASVDTVGTTTQGVVSYNATITFDSQDDRLKSGMNVLAAVITDVAPDVLTVPNSAIKHQGDNTYVEVLVLGSPQQRTVQTGLANDTMTEIVSGIHEGDPVITQTIDPSATTTTQTNRGTGIPGLGGGGAFRSSGLR